VGSATEEGGLTVKNLPGKNVIGGVAKKVRRELPSPSSWHEGITSV